MFHARALRIVTVLGLLFCAEGVRAEQSFDAEATQPSRSGRPKIGVALSGGGAKGMAHIGVLRVLEELNVPIDYLAGTSMGSIVGGLYATGLSSEDLRQIVLNVDWDDALRDEPRRKDLTFRRKEDDLRYPTDFQLGIRNGKIVWPSGFLTGQKLYFLLQALTLPVAEVNDFDDLAIPFRAVATDLSTGDPVILEDGNLATALRASMAIPAVFSPVEWSGKTLVDGGISNNVPVDVVRAMGADIVIAIDLGLPLTSRQVESLPQIHRQTMRMLVRKNMEAQLDNADLVLQPQTGSYGTLAFDKVDKLLQLGVDEARAHEEDLKRLSVDPGEYERIMGGHVPAPEPKPVIDYVRFEGNQRVDDRIIEARLRVNPGEPVDLDAVFEDVSRIYGLGDFKQVSFALERTDAGNGLLIEMVEKPWGPNFLNFGLFAFTDFAGDLDGSILANVTLTRMNARGAEWRNDIRLGRRRRLYSEFYQPLDFHGRFFFAPRIDLDADRRDLWIDGVDVASVDYRSYLGAFDFGYQIHKYGELRLGYERGIGDASVAAGLVPPGTPSSGDFDLGAVRVLARLDRLDNANVPRNGSYGVADLRYSRDGLGGEVDYDRYDVKIGYWKSWGRHTGLGSIAGGWSPGSTLPLYDEFTIGGFFSLSGFAPEELRGQYYGVARLGYYYHMTRRIFLGGWAESGNVWKDSADATFDSLILTGTLFAGMDSIIGPVYLAYGHAEGGKRKVYMIIGRTF